MASSRVVTAAFLVLCFSCGQNVAFHDIQTSKPTSAGGAAGTGAESSLPAPTSGTADAAAAASAGTPAKAAVKTVSAEKAVGSATATATGTGTGSNLEKIDPATATPADIADACAAGTMLTASQDLNFASSASYCDYGENGNLARTSGEVAARREEALALSLPANAIICGIGVTSKDQAMTFDDDIMLTLDGAVLAATADFTPLFAKSGGLAVYDWTKIVGLKHTGGDRPQYCLGAAGDCVMPAKKAISGTMQVSLDDKTAEELSLFALRAGKLDIGWITSGADSDNDCKHTPFVITVSAKYIVGS